MVVGDEGVEQVGEGSEGGLVHARAIQVAVVDGLAAGWIAEGGLEGLCGREGFEVVLLVGRRCHGARHD